MKKNLDKTTTSNDIKKSNNSFAKFVGSGGLFGFIILIIFIIVFSHYIRTGSFIDFTFKSLVEYLSTMPDVSVNFTMFDLTITEHWPVFLEPIRYIINFFTAQIEFGITIIGLASQAILVLFYLASMFFI